MTATQPTLLPCQKQLFRLPDGVHYLNCATRSPFSLSVEQAGHDALTWHANPFGLRPDDFFDGSNAVRTKFAQLISLPDPERVALIPSVSYGMAIVARNLPHKPGIRSGQHILLVGDEFPSDVYAWDRVVADLGLTIRTVPMPQGFPKGSHWNEQLLDAITTDTALVVAPPAHWMYGTRFDLVAIGRRARDVGAWLAVDGTQSVGALPFDWQQIQPDVLICAGYKWLMGPYSMGLACFGPAFDGGIPLEEGWMNRLDSNQFHRLMDYQSVYRPKAYRYNVGEQTHFIQMPMLDAALTQILDWQPARIQAYTEALMAPVWAELEPLGCRVDAVDGTVGRSHHLVGVWLPEQADPMAVAQVLHERNVSISARSGVLRIAPHLYNTPDDAQALVDALHIALR